MNVENPYFSFRDEQNKGDVKISKEFKALNSNFLKLSSNMEALKSADGKFGFIKKIFYKISICSYASNVKKDLKKLDQTIQQKCKNLTNLVNRMKHAIENEDINLFSGALSSMKDKKELIGHAENFLQEMGQSSGISLETLTKEFNIA